MMSYLLNLICISGCICNSGCKVHMYLILKVEGRKEGNLYLAKYT